MAEPDKFTRREIQEIRPKIEEAIRREDFEAFLEIIISKLGVQRGSDRCRFFESKF
jgi:septin family protein